MEMMVCNQLLWRLKWAGFDLVLGVLMLAGCGPSQPGFAGTYVSKVVVSGSEVYDTLRVEKVSSGVFGIYRSSRFRITGDGSGAREWKLERESWTADLDASGILVERRYGKRISLDAGAGELRVGSRRYKRVE
jgi:hypothetical protein